MILKHFKKYFSRYKKRFFLALFFLMLETAGDLIQPMIMAKIIDDGVKQANLEYIWKLGGLMIIMTGLGAISAVVRNIVSSKVSQNFGADLREDLYIKIQGFSFDNVDEFEDASLITRLTNDVNQIQDFGHRLMRIFVKAPVLGIGATIMAFILNAKLALIVLAIIPFVGFVIFLNLRISYPIFTGIQKSIDKVNGVMREYLAGIRVVKAFNRFSYEKNRFKRVNQGLKDITLKGMRVVAIFNPIVSLLINIGIVLVLWFGGIRINTGDMEVGQIIAFVNYMTRVLYSLVMMTRILNVFIRARTSAERIADVFEAENTIVGNQYSKSARKMKGYLEFKDVYFKYRTGGRCVLEDINFRVEEGETLAIIGSTGSGKSSLVNLIPRFYDVDRGSIKISGIDIRELSLDELRGLIGIVPQKVLLFSGTIRENIKWGHDRALDEDIERVAHIAEVHNFIQDFNDGYETYLGQGGLNLSGGQKQRVSIARALIRKPSILILDDSTSAVDLITERSIRKKLKEYLANTTTILIAQRITSVIDADKILVMDKGRIVDQGKHEELIKRCQVYMDIYDSQLGKEGLINGL